MWEGGLGLGLGVGLAEVSELLGPMGSLWRAVWPELTTLVDHSPVLASLLSLRCRADSDKQRGAAVARTFADEFSRRSSGRGCACCYRRGMTCGRPVSKVHHLRTKRNGG